MTNVSNIRVESGGQEIAARLFQPDPSNEGAILFLSGWRSTKESAGEGATLLASIGYSALAFDFRGMGESEGDIQELTRTDYLDDCVATYDRLVAESSPKRVCLVGTSFGSYLACLLTEQRQVSDLVLRVPANYPDESFDSPQVLISDSINDGAKTDEVTDIDTRSLRALGRFSGNILVVQSGNDQILNQQTVLDYVAAPKTPASLEHIVMEGAPHALSGSPVHRKAFNAILVDWLTNTNDIPQA